MKGRIRAQSETCVPLYHPSNDEDAFDHTFEIGRKVEPDASRYEALRV
jgi:hypothetical protein